MFSLRAPGAEEPGSIRLDMSRNQFATVFSENLHSVPYAIGVNSHRGSLLTRHPGHMRWLMEEISAHGNLIFVDSYTTARSVALDLARESGVAAARRDVFLDPDREPETVEREFARLKRLAAKRGMAVGSDMNNDYSKLSAEEIDQLRKLLYNQRARPAPETGGLEA